MSQPEPVRSKENHPIISAKFQRSRPGSAAVLVKVAGWRVFGGLGLSCGGKNSLGRADFSWILEYLEEKSWESIGIKNFRSF